MTELKTLEQVEREHIVYVMRACNFNRTKASKILKIGIRTLQRRLIRWGLKDIGSLGSALDDIDPRTVR
jgi:DNA-binding NtrC family response regulator